MTDLHRGPDELSLLTAYCLTVDEKNQVDLNSHRHKLEEHRIGLQHLEEADCMSLKVVAEVEAGMAEDFVIQTC